MVAALIAVIRVPIPATGGYTHPGAVAEVFIALAFGPVVGMIAAGFGADREQEADECIPVTIDSIGFKPTRNTFALCASGDSMIGKHICDGDSVVREPDMPPSSKSKAAGRLRNLPLQH